MYFTEREVVSEGSIEPRCPNLTILSYTNILPLNLSNVNLLIVSVDETLLKKTQSMVLSERI
jgi:hypothetical protein